MESRPFSTKFRPILTYLDRFNHIDAFTVEGGHNNLSFAVIKSKVTEHFLRKLGLSEM